MTLTDDNDDIPATTLENRIRWDPDTVSSFIAWNRTKRGPDAHGWAIETVTGDVVREIRHVETGRIERAASGEEGMGWVDAETARRLVASGAWAIREVLTDVRLPVTVIQRGYRTVRVYDDLTGPAQEPLAGSEGST